MPIRLGPPLLCDSLRRCKSPHYEASTSIKADRWDHWRAERGVEHQPPNLNRLVHQRLGSTFSCLLCYKGGQWRLALSQAHQVICAQKAAPAARRSWAAILLRRYPSKQAKAKPAQHWNTYAGAQDHLCGSTRENITSLELMKPMSHCLGVCLTGCGEHTANEKGVGWQLLQSCCKLSLAP